MLLIRCPATRSDNSQLIVAGVLADLKLFSVLHWHLHTHGAYKLMQTCTHTHKENKYCLKKATCVMLANTTKKKDI